MQLDPEGVAPGFAPEVRPVRRQPGSRRARSPPVEEPPPVRRRRRRRVDAAAVGGRGLVEIETRMNTMLKKTPGLSLRTRTWVRLSPWLAWLFLLSSSSFFSSLFVSFSFSSAVSFSLCASREHRTRKQRKSPASKL